ncbi:MAG: NUDIX hydrolase [Dehalococcoidia bacterium]|nr:NUDIX hydrolase [Dehalococcoidia bacterium]
MGTQERRVEQLVSAGGVVVQVRDGRLEVVLCGHASPEQWRLPKGTPDPGETLEQTALREVREETGLEVKLLAPVDSISYWFVGQRNGVRFHKTVYFFLMEPIGGSPESHDAEFDEVRWFSIEEAVNRLAFQEEARMVHEAMRQVTGVDHEQR